MADLAFETDGYLIVTKHELVLDRFMSEVRTDPEYLEFVEDLRAWFAEVDPSRYRGVYRDEFVGVSEEDMTRPNSYHKSDSATARIRMSEILGYKYNGSGIWSDFRNIEDSFPRYADALSIWLMIENKNDFEIIRLRRDNYEPNELTLGFDIGYWGPNTYSIVCDTFARPRWHPPPESEWPLLEPFVENLNENVLFKDFESANAFLDFYRKTDWGEFDDRRSRDPSRTDFFVIQVDSCPTTH